MPENLSSLWGLKSIKSRSSLSFQTYIVFCESELEGLEGPDDADSDDAEHEGMVSNTREVDARKKLIYLWKWSFYVLLKVPP